MRSCKGCRHLLKMAMLEGPPLCRASDPKVEWVKDPWTGKEYPRSNGFRLTVGQMRRAGAECGPEGRLWEPNLWRRILRRIRRQA